MTIRPADRSDIQPLADLWFEGWRDAHEKIVPPELVAVRTRESFVPRLEVAMADILEAGPPGAPVGFCMLRGDELYQFYVARSARGSGVAGLLIRRAETELLRRGTSTAWLTCAIGNSRAARFYETHGWHLTGSIVDTLSTTAGPFRLEVWRYEKRLAPA